MANDFIGINTGVRLGGSLMAGAQNMRWAKDVLEALKEAMDHMIAGADYTVIEAQFGVPSGKGQTVYNLVAGTITDMNASTNIPQLLQWLATCKG